MSKNKNLSVSLETIHELPEEEPRFVRLRRYFWLLGAAVVSIVFLSLGLFKNNSAQTSPEIISEGANSPDATIEKFHLVSTVQGQKGGSFFLMWPGYTKIKNKLIRTMFTLNIIKKTN